MDNTINSLVSKAVGVTDQQIRDFLATGPSDAQIVAAMGQFGVSPTQLSSVVGMPEGQVVARIAATVPPGQSVTVGDTVVQPQYQTVGQGQDQQVGGLQNVITYKTSENKTDGSYNQYSATGQLERTGTQQKVDTSLGGAVKQMVQNPGFKIAALAYGGNALNNTLGGVGSTLAADADIAGGLIPEFGANTAYDAFMSNAMTPAALASLAATVAANPEVIGSGSLLTNASAGLPTVTPTVTPPVAPVTPPVAPVTPVTPTGIPPVIPAVIPPTTTPISTLLPLATGLTASALGNVAGSVANQAGISDARSLINQYGTQAATSLADAYKNAQGLNTANRADLTSNYSNASTVLNDLYNKQVGYQKPYQDIGQAGSLGLLANQDYLTRQFTNADLNANLAPNYAFQLAQGQMANQRAANMGGGSMGGNALQGLQRYTQDYAGNAYQNAFNNFNTQRQNIYGNLSKMADIGTTSAGQLANLGSSLGGTYGNLSSGYGGNLTTSAGQGIGAANAYGLNTAGLATGIGSALASNATQSGANTSSLLSNLGNTALLGSLIKAT